MIMKQKVARGLEEAITIEEALQAMGLSDETIEELKVAIKRHGSQIIVEQYFKEQMNE